MMNDREFTGGIDLGGWDIVMLLVACVFVVLPGLALIKCLKFIKKRRLELLALSLGVLTGVYFVVFPFNVNRVENFQAVELPPLNEEYYLAGLPCEYCGVVTNMHIPTCKMFDVVGRELFGEVAK